MSESRWFCFDGIDEYKLVTSPERSFEDAKVLCAAEGATLGRISSVCELVATIALGEEIEASETWIGVEFDSGSGLDVANPNGYRYVDGFDDESFFQVGRGNFPWDSNDPFDNDDRACVAMTPRMGDFSWTNDDCTREKRYLCRRSCRNSLEKENIIGGMIFGFAIIFLAFTYYRVRKFQTIVSQHDSQTIASVTKV